MDVVEADTMERELEGELCPAVLAEIMLLVEESSELEADTTTGVAVAEAGAEVVEEEEEAETLEDEDAAAGSVCGAEAAVGERGGEVVDLTGIFLMTA